MNQYLTILFFLFFYSALNSIAAIEISSKIDFDSEDVPSSDSSADKSDPVVIVVENSNAEAHKETRGFLSPSSRPRAGGNVSLRGPVKPIRSHSNYPHAAIETAINTSSSAAGQRSDKKKKKFGIVTQLNGVRKSIKTLTHPNPKPARPKVMKNIYIIVNGKGNAQPGNFVCKEGVCQTTLSTDFDDRGNVIGGVCITIVTKTEDSKVEDVPVIDGIRGTGYDNRNPSFAFNNGRASPNPPFLDNNIPQTLHRQNHTPRRNRFRPQSASFYPSNFGPRKEIPTWSPWIPSSVDDKIEAPLSRTKSSE